MASFKALELSVGVGSEISQTVDISNTDCGLIRLVHDDFRVLEADYRRIVDLMPSMFVTESPQ